MEKQSSQRLLANRVVQRTARGLFVVLAAMSLSGIASAQDTKFFVSTGNTDGKLGAVSRRPSTGKVETETADDFFLKQTTVISGATITGLISPATTLQNITNVEVEFYHVFPTDSANPDPLAGKVPSRTNSPSDVEIGSATRDGSLGTLRFGVRLLDANSSAKNTVINGIKGKPDSPTTHGEGPATGETVEIAITFTNPIVLPAGHYFFRPEVLVTGADFLYLSAPRPIVAPGTLFAGDLQAWIRNSNLSPDWLRIGTDIINNTTPAPTFNMTFSLTGNTIPDAGTPDQASCHGKSISALAVQFGDITAAASTLGFSSVQALQDAVSTFCEP